MKVEVVGGVTIVQDFVLRGRWSVSSKYGPREPIPIPGGGMTGSFHGGIDVPAPELTPLYAVSPGTVDVLDVDALDSTGLMVSYKAPDGWWVRVFHTSPKGIRLPVGSHVEAGSIIGFVGTTGYSTGNHAHIQIHRPDGRTIDPLSLRSASTG